MGFTRCCLWAQGGMWAGGAVNGLMPPERGCAWARPVSLGHDRQGSENFEWRWPKPERTGVKEVEEACGLSSFLHWTNKTKDIDPMKMALPRNRITMFAKEVFVIRRRMARYAQY
jgi:hypothetical protein